MCVATFSHLTPCKETSVVVVVVSKQKAGVAWPTMHICCIVSTVAGRRIALSLYWPIA
jgi:hypothetical protein